MLAIKLRRVGKKKQPSFRIIVLEKHKDPWGDYLECVGFYNPRTNPKTIELKRERIKYWLEKGAQPTPTVHNLLVDADILPGSKKKATKMKKKHLERLKEKKGEKEAEGEENKKEEGKEEQSAEKKEEKSEEKTEEKNEEKSNADQKE